MANSVPQTVNKGTPELARRARGFFGLMSRIARLAGVSRAHVSFVLSGQRASAEVMRIALREITRAEAGRYQRRAA